MNINLYENKSGHYEHIYFIIKLYENKPIKKYCPQYDNSKSMNRYYSKILNLDFKKIV
jgi:hypothetical protein